MAFLSLNRQTSWAHWPRSKAVVTEMLACAQAGEKDTCRPVNRRVRAWNLQNLANSSNRHIAKAAAEDFGSEQGDWTPEFATEIASRSGDLLYVWVCKNARSRIAVDANTQLVSVERMQASVLIPTPTAIGLRPVWLASWHALLLPATERRRAVLTAMFYLKVGFEGDLEQHSECAEHIRAVSARTGVRKEVTVVPDGLNTCLRITVWVNSVEMFHMLIGGLTDWASVHYGRAVLEIIN